MGEKGSTKERLAKALDELGEPDMAEQARRGHYDDFESELTYPLIQLGTDLIRKGHIAMAQRVIDGEFDATREESDAWFKEFSQTAEGKDLLNTLPHGFASKLH